VPDPAVRPESPGAAQAGITFTAVWDPNGDNLQATGTLSYDAAGNVQIQFSWVSLQDGTSHAFAGVLTGAAGSYHIEGSTYVRSTGESHNMTGDQRVVADFTGVGFVITDDNGTAHQLQIQAQSPQADGSATFTGVCDGQFGNGSIFYDAAGTLHMWFVGADESTVDSIISGDPGAYQFAGSLTSPDGTTIHATGVQTAAPVAAVADFSDVSLAPTDDSGTAHQLQILTQNAQPDGTATFTALWDGQDSTGTLAYDDAGNIHITFTGVNFSFDGTITVVAGAYQLDQVHVSGDQTVAPVSQVTDLTHVTFALTNDSGTYQLQIQTQTAQPDGTTTFTGQFDGFSAHVGPEIAGTLTQDDAGNILITFDCAHGYVFVATISGTPGAFHLDGSLTAADVAAVPVTGNQIA
jgi:hypothetical protein